MVTMSDGVTSGPTSEPSACPEIPTVENAEVSPSSLKSKYNKGDLLMYNCQQGYVGRVHFICDGHKWQNTRNSKCARKSTVSLYMGNVFVHIVALGFMQVCWDTKNKFLVFITDVSITVNYYYFVTIKI